MNDRQKRLLYRAMHRGMKETDTLIGGFAQANLATMSDEDIAAFDLLLDESDNRLMSWVLECEAVPPGELAGIVQCLIAYRKSL